MTSPVRLAGKAFPVTIPPAFFPVDGFCHLFIDRIEADQGERQLDHVNHGGGYVPGGVSAALFLLLKNEDLG